MPKFYVQCGPATRIVQAESAVQAGMSLIDQALQPHLWIYDDPNLTTAQCEDHLMMEALLHLDADISVSEQGFGRSDAMMIPTHELIVRWHKLIVGMQRLFVIAGAGSRRVSEIAASDVPLKDTLTFRPKPR